MVSSRWLGVRDFFAVYLFLRRMRFVPLGLRLRYGLGTLPFGSALADSRSAWLPLWPALLGAQIHSLG